MIALLLAALRDARSALPIVLACVVLGAAACGGGDRNDGSATAEPLNTDTTAGEPSPTGLPKLFGTVGSTDDPDASEIRLVTEDGAEVTTTLPPGRYLLEIDDLSTIHNFHLGGPLAAVDVATDVAGTGAKTAVILLQDGEVYRYVCDAHPNAMNETFSVHDQPWTRN